MQSAGGGRNKVTFRHCLLSRRSGVRYPDPPTLEKSAKGICLCNLLRLAQPNDRDKGLNRKEGLS